MPIDLPEPRVVPTPAFSPRMSLLMAVSLMLGVLGLFVGLGKPPSQIGSAPAPDVRPSVAQLSR